MVTATGFGGWKSRSGMTPTISGLAMKEMSVSQMVTVPMSQVLIGILLVQHWSAAHEKPIKHEVLRMAGNLRPSVLLGIHGLILGWCRVSVYGWGLEVSAVDVR